VKFGGILKGFLVWVWA